MASKLWGEKQSQDLAWWIRKAIVKRTMGGVSAEGKAFKPIKDGKATKATNLMRSGYMVDSVFVEPNESSLTIRSRAPYARYVEEQGRPWLGLTPAEQADADREVARLLDETEAKMNAEWKAKNP